MEFFNLKIMDQDVREYMISIVQKTIEHREKNNSTRKDFIQCLIQLRNDGQISVDDGLWDSENVTNSTKSMTIEQCAAQVFLFYLAGFDTSASTVAYCLFELTRNPECLAKLREEIAETFQRNNGQLTYEAFKDMPYLDLCVMGKFFMVSVFFLFLLFLLKLIFILNDLQPIVDSKKKKTSKIHKISERMIRQIIFNA